MLQLVVKFSFLPRLIFNCRTFSRGVQHVDDVSEQKTKCRPIKTWDIGGVTLSGVLYVNLPLAYVNQFNFFLKFRLVIVLKSKLLQRYFSMNFLPILRNVFLKTLIDCFYASSSELLWNKICGTAIIVLN